MTRITEADVLTLADTVWCARTYAPLWDGWRSRRGQAGDRWAWDCLLDLIERGAARIGDGRPEVTR